MAAYKPIGMVIILLFALIAGCSDSVSPEINQKYIISISTWQAPDSGGSSDPVQISGVDTALNLSWRVYSDSSWLSATPDTGSTPGFFTITADSNLTGLDRSANLNIVIDDDARITETVTVNQNSRRGLTQIGLYSIPYRHCLETMHVDGDFAYTAGCMTGLIVVDIRDHASPYDYAWVQTECYEEDIAKSGDLVFIAGLHEDELQLIGMVEIYDVSNPLHPRIKSRIESEYAKGCAVSGDYLYLADYSSLRIYDISDPVQPDSIAAIATSGGTISVAVSQSYVLYSEEGRGVHIADISDPSNPAEIGQYQLPGFISDIHVSGQYAFLACYEKGVKIIDISNPHSPTLAGEYDSQGQAYKVSADQDYLYVAAFANYVHILDISEISEPKLFASHKTPTQVFGVAASGGYAYAIDRKEGFYTYRLIP